MAWIEFTRRRYQRSGGRYASDAEWALIAPLMPAPKRIGRPRTTDLRDVVDAILYIAETGCQGRMLPNDTPPVSVVRRYFYGWRDNGLLGKLNLRRVAAARLAEGRAETPAAGVIDSQSVKTTQSGGVRGYDAGKRIKGRKRHIVTDTAGPLVGRAGLDALVRLQAHGNETAGRPLAVSASGSHDGGSRWRQALGRSARTTARRR